MTRKKSNLQSATKLLTHSPFLPPISSLWSLSSPLACPFSPPSPQTMLCRNCCDLEEQTSNIEWGSRVFSTVYCARKWVVLFGAVKVLWKDNVSTKYVTDCRCRQNSFFFLSNSNSSFFFWSENDDKDPDVLFVPLPRLTSALGLVGPSLPRPTCIGSP